MLSRAKNGTGPKLLLITNKKSHMRQPSALLFSVSCYIIFIYRPMSMCARDVGLIKN